jgi:TatD DNase family protein
MRGVADACGVRRSLTVAFRLSSTVIDTHCHLTFPDFEAGKYAGGVTAVLAKARGHGVMGCITICTTTQDAPNVLAMAKAHENVWCSAGVHPLYADQQPHQWDWLRPILADPKCVAWGELGLDNHYKDPPGAMQREVLDAQLDFIQRYHREHPTNTKPIVIHCREAFDDLIPVLARTSLAPERFVFHCFTGTPSDMRKVLDFGACVSFTGVATYRNAPELREAVKLVPLDRIMIETDAPFLSPHPHRGVRPCEPWMASVTAQAVAELRGEAWAEFHAAINRTTQRFFGVRVDGDA